MHFNIIVSNTTSYRWKATSFGFSTVSIHLILRQKGVELLEDWKNLFYTLIDFIIFHLVLAEMMHKLHYYFCFLLYYNEILFKFIKINLIQKFYKYNNKYLFTQNLFNFQSTNPGDFQSIIKKNHINFSDVPSWTSLQDVLHIICRREHPYRMCYI